MQKILEIKSTDWMKGLSIQSGLALGGLFQTAQFDPFETMGYFQPPLSPVQIDGTTITTKVNFLASFVNGASGFMAALGDRSGTGEKTLYVINTSASTVVEYNDQIDQNAQEGAITRSGLAIYKNRIIYEQGSSLRSNLLVPAAASDANLLTTALTSGTPNTPTAFGIGSDGVLYYTATSGASIGKILSVTDTTGNTASAFSFTDTSLTAKDITNDGVYTIFIADSNTNKVTVGTVSCRIFFWDTIKTKADVIWDIPDSYLIAARYVDGKVLVLGASGIWACNSATPPKLVLPLSSALLPTNSYKVTAKGNTIYWIRNSGGRVYAYGSQIGKPIWYNPYLTTGSDNLGNALAASGSYLVASVDAGTNTPKVYLHNSGSTRDNVTVQTATLPLTQPFKFEYAKVTLKAPLSSGQTVYFSLYNGNGAVISDTNSQSFATNGAKQALIFTAKAGTNNKKQFEDAYVTITSSGGAVVQRVAIYGTPIGDDSQI
jgi:hypothetical protein